MASGFRGMGYEPILLDEPETPTAFQARHLTYAYIESGIPAVLSLNFPVDGGHAIAVMGHALSVGREPQWEVFESRDSPQLRFADASQFAPAFVAQDDAGGPFRSIEFIDQRDWASDSVVRLLQRKKEFRTSYLALKDSFTCGVVLDRDTPEPEFGFLQGILIPSPPRVTLGPDDAQRKACALLVKAEQEFRPHLSGGFVLRTYLRRSNAFKSHCRSAGALLPETTRRLCWHPMPKWLWITEVSDLAHHRRREECIAGLIIQDAAGHIEAQPMEDLIAMVTPSSLILGHPDSKAPLLDAELSRHRQGFFSRFARPRDGGTKHT